MITYPVALHLPEGVAYLAPGMAVYLIAGVPIDVDVEIPEDLERADYFWNGSFLCRDGDPLLCIATITHGLPGVFDVARGIEASRAPAEPMQMAMWE